MPVMPLNLYLIAREVGEVEHDQMESVVVAAPTAAIARQVARTARGDQSPDVWAPATAKSSKIGEAARAVRQGIVHENYQRG